MKLLEVSLVPASKAMEGCTIALLNPSDSEPTPCPALGLAMSVVLEDEER